MLSQCQNHLAVNIIRRSIFLRKRIPFLVFFQLSVNDLHELPLLSQHLRFVLSRESCDSGKRWIRKVYQLKTGNPVLSTAKFFQIDAMGSDRGLPIIQHVSNSSTGGHLDSCTHFSPGIAKL